MPEATATALEGLGVSAQLAELMGAEPNTQAGATTAQATATVLYSRSSEITAASSQTAFVFKSTVGINEPQLVFNSSATSALVFVPVGHTLNGSSNGSLTVAQNKAAMFWQYKYKLWTSILTA